VHFRGSDAVECLDCEHDLTIRRWEWRMPILEPVIAGFELAIAEAFAGKAPHPGWAGEISAASFRRLVTDLIWTLITEDLADPHLGLALVDRVVPGRFALKEPYGWRIETPFHRRSAAAREAVLAAMLLTLRGAEMDDALGVSGKELAKTAEFRPFVEALRFVGENKDEFWKHVQTWPGDIQDRAGGALRYLQSQRQLLNCRTFKERRTSRQHGSARSRCDIIP
jgi:hypothetical protein